MELTTLDWDEKYSVGFKLIDEQHKRLFGIYNDIVRIQKITPLPQTEIARLIKELSDYVHTHFLTEEEVMRIYGYAGYENHKKMHDQFAESVHVLCADFQSGDLILMASVVKKIKTWLLHHVIGEDRGYLAVIPHDVK